MEEDKKISKEDREWKAELDAEQYRVLRLKGTERAFTGRFDRHKQTGVYTCAGCGNALFSSESKYDSGSGWPSYFEVYRPDSVVFHTDISHGMKRVEVCCARCGGHLGHVFDDGPKPTGKRYCINSVSLNFDSSK